ncbi:glycosyltransferase family 39 protein [Acidocella aromatica]|uniref:Glycosyltransferase RgtA/B/C/D-like domain-containing protein n=1 Tax=Acidocella aromatica TaxID=1303579 RepID=A0A840VQF0_9PROT|nr:glycosyltransferase family 39 protein [Acidocella aromatica]MBB5373831.1 hypothetical protein [Acidocella aromatica]
MNDRRVAVFLCSAAVLLLGIAWLRGSEYDEAYSIFLTAGHARPAWPSGVFTAGAVRWLYAGGAGFWRVAQDLRAGDVHPPLYFWVLDAWRQVFGPSWFAARALSVLFTLGGLALLACLAEAAAIPVLSALALTLLSYGFAYTGVVARGFALAQLCDIGGVLLLFLATRERRWRVALAGGALFGAASFSNYLAIFTGVAALLWLCRVRWRLVPAALAGLVPFLLPDAWFFLVQRGSRAAQFVAFSPGHALDLLAKDAGAVVFGGLPVYAGAFALPVTLVLLALIVAGLGYVLRRRHEWAGLFALLALATPVGLLALGLVFHNTPIEIRYLGFATPWLALLLAPALPRWLLAVMLGAQAAAIAGLAFAASTMQPQGLAAREAASYPGALVVVPLGNDGVGVPGPFIAAAPDAMRLRLFRAGPALDVQGETQVVLVTLGVDGASQAASAQMLDAMRLDRCFTQVARTPLIAVFDRGCADQ